MQVNCDGPAGVSIAAASGSLEGPDAAECAKSGGFVRLTAAVGGSSAAAGPVVSPPLAAAAAPAFWRAFLARFLSAFSAAAVPAAALLSSYRSNTAKACQSRGRVTALIG